MKRTLLLLTLLLALPLAACKSPTAFELIEAVNFCESQPDPRACLGARALGWAGVDDEKLLEILEELLALYDERHPGAASAPVASGAGLSGDPGGCRRLSESVKRSWRAIYESSGWSIYQSFGPEPGIAAASGLFLCYGEQRSGDYWIGQVPLAGLVEHRRPFVAGRPDPRNRVSLAEAADCTAASTWAVRGWEEPLRCLVVEAAEVNPGALLASPGIRGQVEIVADEVFSGLGLDPCAEEHKDFTSRLAAYLAACSDPYVTCAPGDEIRALVARR